MSLPTDADERKAIPIYTGFICYFPDAIAEVAKLSKRGGDQHNPGERLYWDRSKSGDECDALARHLVGTATAESLDEELADATAVAWRSMANLQKLCERREKASGISGERAAFGKFRDETLVYCAE